MSFYSYYKIVNYIVVRRISEISTDHFSKNNPFFSIARNMQINLLEGSLGPRGPIEMQVS